MTAEHIAEIAAVSGSSVDRIQRILTALLDDEMPLLPLTLRDAVTPDVVDSIQAAVLRVELAKQGSTMRM